MENTYVIYDETNECIIIDPGCYDDREKAQLLAFIEQKNLTVKLLLNTHCHIDHVLGNKFILDRFGVDFYIHQDDLETLNAVEAYAPNYGFTHYKPAQPSGYLEAGDQVSFGNTTLEVIFVPGHAIGHIAFYHKESQSCISGDVLFKESVGRTDLPGGDHGTLLNSIHQKLFTLPEETTIYPGHGDKTSIDYEKSNNPYCSVR